MATISITDLELKENESLILTYHRQTRKWWSVVGPMKGPMKGRQRAVGEGDTAIEALGEMLIDMGHPQNGGH